MNAGRGLGLEGLTWSAESAAVGKDGLSTGG